jgi:hypothetical protein
MAGRADRCARAVSGHTAIATQDDLGSVRSGRRPPAIPVFLGRNRQDDAVRAENRVDRTRSDAPKEILVALAVLVIGIGMIELLALSI